MAVWQISSVNNSKCVLPYGCLCQIKSDKLQKLHSMTSEERRHREKQCHWNISFCFSTFFMTFSEKTPKKKGLPLKTRPLCTIIWCITNPFYAKNQNQSQKSLLKEFFKEDFFLLYHRCVFFPFKNIRFLIWFIFNSFHKGLCYIDEKNDIGTTKSFSFWFSVKRKTTSWQMFPIYLEFHSIRIFWVNQQVFTFFLLTQTYILIVVVTERELGNTLKKVWIERKDFPKNWNCLLFITTNDILSSQYNRSVFT